MPTRTHSIKSIPTQPQGTAIVHNTIAEGESIADKSDIGESIAVGIERGIDQNKTIQVLEVRELAQTQHPILQKTIELKVQLHSQQKLPVVPTSAEQVQLNSMCTKQRTKTQQNAELKSTERKNQTQLLRKTTHQQLPTLTHPLMQRGKQLNR